MNARPASRWSLADVIDLEFLSADADFRPRERFVGADRREVFRLALERWRAERFGARASPGRELVSLGAWIAAALALLGLLAARALVWGFFDAGPSALRPEPVNVLPLFLGAVALPFLFTLYGFWSALGVRLAPWLPRLPAFLRGSIAGRLQALARRAIERAGERMPAGQRLDAEAALGALRQRFTARRGPLAAALLTAVQTFGLAFALGIVASLAYEQAFRSSAFGWQTNTPSVTAERLHAVVQTIATPWRAVANSPALTEIAATRFVRYRDPAAFPPEAAYAWAGFLGWAALVYGLAPRVLLSLLGWAQFRAALARERFDELRFDGLWARLRGGRTGFSATEGDAAPEEIRSFAEAPGLRGGGTCRVVCPEEIFTPEFEMALAGWVRERRDWTVTPPVVRWPAAPLEDLAGSARVLLVQEAFMPPIGETLDLVAAVRSAVGPDAVILVALLGKPEAPSPLGRLATATEVEVWRKKMRALGDPALDVAALIEPQPLP